MSKVHIYTAKLQPATRFKDDTGARTFWIRNPGNRLKLTACCHERRPAKNLLVQVYYDRNYFWCKEGKGCKT